MSLSHIRALRTEGYKPGGWVRVLIGEGARWLEDGPTVVRVNPRIPVSGMDWAVMAGLPVVVHRMNHEGDVAFQVLTELQRVGAKLIGASDKWGPKAMTNPTTQAEEIALRREWESLWTI